MRKVGIGVLVAASIASGAPAARASSTPPPARAADDLSTPVTFTGTGDLATITRTSDLRDQVPAANPRVLVLGTGVARNLFPTAVAATISGTGADLADPHGYGTLAASTILQLAPGARVTSRALRSADATWHLLDLASLADALDAAYATRAQHDAILFAFPPNGALDPLAHLIGHADYGAFGKGDALLAEALLTARAPLATRGIPLDDDLRERIFAASNDRQRDAVERYVQRVRAWTRVTDAISRLTDAGVAIVAPAGDFTRSDRSGVITALPHQTIYGVAALPQVITVGAAYTDGPTAGLGAWRVSPTSGRGPTLALDAKPDVVASSDIVAMLPANSSLRWADDSTRTPGAMMTWAQAGVTPTACPSPTGAYRCVLQGSSMIAAALVATNLAASVSRGVPHLASARAPQDDEILRGLAWASASPRRALASRGSATGLPSPNGPKTGAPVDRVASPFEQGVGVFTGLRDLDISKTPIALARATLGEVGFRGRAATARVPFWSEAAPPNGIAIGLTDRLGPDVSGRAVLADAPDGIASAVRDVRDVTITVPAAARPGGVYVGRLTAGSTVATATAVPVSVVQDIPFRFHADYAYNELMGDGAEGERVEDASVILMAGLPAGIGLVGEAFKSLSGPIERRLGGDPAHNIILRTGRAGNTFTTPSLPASEHGRGTIEAVPPGFYRFHLLTDHRVEARQEDGTLESLGIGLGSFGPDGFSSPSHAILLPADAPCGAGGPAPCASRATTETEVDERTGFCVARNATTGVRFGVYCDEVAYAVPSAIVTRAVHLVERAEWDACSVSLSADGSILSMAGLIERASSCGADQVVPLRTTPNLPGTAWQVGAGSPTCLAPGEQASFANGHPNDLTARYAPTAAVGQDRLPALVLTTTVPLPYLNTYTTGTLAMAYETRGAVVAARFDAGPDRTADASHSILTVAGSGIEIPGRAPIAPRGIYEDEWAVMSANQPTARLSLIVFPTDVARNADLALCNVALRISTFAKQSYGDRDGARTRTFPMLDRGLSQRIDPTSRRIRAHFTGARFADLQPIRESAVVATHVPRNTTRHPASAHRVRSPIGGPALHAMTRRWGTDGRAHEAIAGVALIDARGGATSLACTSQEPTCQAWQQARSRSAILAELSPDLVVNGRFFGYSVAREAQLAAGAGNLAYTTRLDADDAGTTSWSPGQRITVSDFPTRVTATPSVGPLDPVVQVLRDPAGRATLRIIGLLPGGAPLVAA